MKALTTALILVPLVIILGMAVALECLSDLAWALYGWLRQKGDADGPLAQ